MRRAVRVTIKALVGLIVACALVLAVVWPWPVPEVDWRAPLATALAQNECKRAASILFAASMAGSIESYQGRAELAQRNICADEWDGLLDRTEALQFHRDKRVHMTNAQLYGLDEHGLGVWRATYVRAAIFLCVAPYDTAYQTDFVAMSADFPDDSWAMALHRQRRNVCIAMLEGMATSLVEDGDDAARRTARRLVGGDPLLDSPHAGFLHAKLLLEQKLAPTNERDPKLVAIFHDIAWSRLRNAAATGHAEAIRLLTKLLHQEQDDKQAYFWVLRARRLGFPESSGASDIERTLSNADRDNTASEEESDWQRTKASFPVD